jgi:hypothetical protein
LRTQVYAPPPPKNGSSRAESFLVYTNSWCLPDFLRDMNKTTTTGARRAPVGRAGGAFLLVSSYHTRNQVYTKNWFPPRNLQPWKGQFLGLYVFWSSTSSHPATPHILLRLCQWSQLRCFSIGSSLKGRPTTNEELPTTDTPRLGITALRSAEQKHAKETNSTSDTQNAKNKFDA